METQTVRLLYYGTAAYGTTSLARLNALRQIAGCVYAVDSRLYEGDYLSRSPITRAARRLVPQVLQSHIGAALLRECHRFHPSAIWIDQGWLVPAWALRTVKERYGALAVHYTPDSLRAPGTNGPVFGDAIREYDCCVTTKEHEVEQYRELGAANVVHTLQGVDDTVFRRLELSRQDLSRYACDVVFVGQEMRDRNRWVEALRRSVSADIRTYGRPRGGALSGWPGMRGRGNWLFGDEYVKALRAAKIALCLLNNEVGDTCTTRTFELPAAGVFMLAQRTEIHTRLFREGVEAAYFDGQEELIQKVRYYLEKDEERQRIAEAAYMRSRELRCSWTERLQVILERCFAQGARAAAPAFQSRPCQAVERRAVI